MDELKDMGFRSVLAQHKEILGLRVEPEINFRVTLWIHPFINLECPSWTEAADK